LSLDTVVFLFVVATSTLITFTLPESYASTARVLVRQDASEVTRKPGMPAPVGAYDPYFVRIQVELIQSEVVLGKVIDALDLNQTWGKKYTDGNPLKTSETLVLLKSRLELRPVLYSALIEIRAFSDNPSEAAALANAIAQSYREYRSGLAPADIVDRAVPGLRPVRPNKPLNIALGILGGIVLALAAGAGMAGIAAWIGRRSRGTGAPPGTGAVPPSVLHPGDAERPKSTLA
jgi:uncharacterized protein involved in exopolysaccharide biosynthesis